MDTEEQILFFKKEILKEITESRFEHSVRVAELAEKFALIFGFPYPRKAYLAGIIHDITKQKKEDFHLSVFRENSFDHSDLPFNAYHPYSAYFYLQTEYGMKEMEILESVKNHTLGGSSLSLLSRILYVSDFLGSDYAARQPEYGTWVSRTENDLKFGLFLKSSTVIRELISKGEKIHPGTIETYNESVRKEFQS